MTNDEVLSCKQKAAGEKKKEEKVKRQKAREQKRQVKKSKTQEQKKKSKQLKTRKQQLTTLSVQQAPTTVGSQDLAPNLCRKRKPESSTKSDNRWKPCFSTNDNVAASVPVYFCLYCGDKYVKPLTEDWIMCHNCSQWYHESCAPARHKPGRGRFVCDSYRC